MSWRVRKLLLTWSRVRLGVRPVSVTVLVERDFPLREELKLNGEDSTPEDLRMFGLQPRIYGGHRHKSDSRR
jgi:hypothetical protein